MNEVAQTLRLSDGVTNDERAAAQFPHRTLHPWSELFSRKDALGTHHYQRAGIVCPLIPIGSRFEKGYEHGQEQLVASVAEPGQARSRPRAASRRPGLRLRLEELEARWVPATVQFNAAAETVNAITGTFSIPVTVTPTVSTFATGFGSPEGLAFDAAGNLYVANEDSGTVSKVTPAGVVSSFASGFNGPFGLAFDAASNLYVANEFNGTVDKVTPAGVVSTFASGFVDPRGLAFDAAGNLYVANRFNATVDKVTSAGVVSTFAGVQRPPGPGLRRRRQPLCRAIRRHR